VRDCVVFGIPDPSQARGDAILAWVVPREGEAGAEWEGQLRSFLLAQLPAWKVPQRILIRDCLPVNERGKVPRSALRDQILGSPRG
jgi:acyl-CoA synthetase (AMP-forming)/AMP-acid ligase II